MAEPSYFAPSPLSQPQSSPQPLPPPPPAAPIQQHNAQQMEQQPGLEVNPIQTGGPTQPSDLQAGLEVAYGYPPAQAQDAHQSYYHAEDGHHLPGDPFLGAKPMSDAGISSIGTRGSTLIGRGTAAGGVHPDGRYESTVYNTAAHDPTAYKEAVLPPGGMTYTGAMGGNYANGQGYGGNGPLPVDGPAQAKPSLWKRKKWFFIGGGLLLLLVIVGAVVGGVLGAKKSGDADKQGAVGGDNGIPSKSGGDPGDTGNPADINNWDDGQNATVRRNTALSVCGWRKPDGTGVEIFLYFRDANGWARRSRFDNSKDFGANNTQWEKSQILNLPGFDTEGHTLEGAMLIHGKEQNPQLQVFYHRAEGIIVPDNATTEFGTDRTPYESSGEAEVSAYWPWVVYQDPNYNLIQLRNSPDSGDVEGDDSVYPSSGWIRTDLGIEAEDDGYLTVVPLGINTANDIFEDGGYGIVYPVRPGNVSKLAVFHPDEDRAVLTPWRDHDFPDLNMSDYGAHGAMTVREGSDTNTINTYILYMTNQAPTGSTQGDEDRSRRLAMVWMDSSSDGWVAGEPSTELIADVNSRIACLTLATSVSNEDGEEMNLESGRGFNRCYFQRDSEVIEVRLQGTDFVETGPVPLR